MSVHACVYVHVRVYVFCCVCMCCVCLCVCVCVCVCFIPNNIFMYINCLSIYTQQLRNTYMYVYVDCLILFYSVHQSLNHEA